MNILIVDDQEKILEATRKLVDWKKLQVKEVFTADSAAEARKILEQSRIDIMLTDIEMPGENGIVLQKWQAEHYPEVVSIFLTSHADFAYAKEAIRNGAFDYILQPASIPDIEEAIRRCIERLKVREMILKKSFRYDAELSGTLESHVFTMFHHKGEFSNMEIWRQDSGTEGKEWWYLPCLMEIWDMENELVKEALYRILKSKSLNQEHEILCTASCLDAAHIGIVFYAKGKIPGRSVIKEQLYFVQQQIRNETGCELNIYLGQFSKDDLPLQIAQIFTFHTDRILERNEVYLVKDLKSDKLHNPNGVVWGEWLVRGDMALIRNQITNLLNYAQEERLLTISYMRQIIHAFLEACTIACYKQNRKLPDLFNDKVPYEQMIHAYSTVQELNEMVDFCLRQYEQMLPQQDSEKGAYTVQERIGDVIRYLDEHMDQMISRRQAAKYIFLNEDYFSRMFFKETGMRYKEYVMQRKVDYAGDLLANTDLPVTVIASKVGYENISSFIKMFRKLTGAAPMEYRRKQQERFRSEK